MYPQSLIYQNSVFKIHLFLYYKFVTITILSIELKKCYNLSLSLIQCFSNSFNFFQVISLADFNSYIFIVSISVSLILSFIILFPLFTSSYTLYFIFYDHIKKSKFLYTQSYNFFMCVRVSACRYMCLWRIMNNNEFGSSGSIHFVLQEWVSLWPGAKRPAMLV